MSNTAIAWYVILFKLLIFLVWGDDDVCFIMYKPYNITFNDTGFRWHEDGYNINIPEYERISFLYTASSLHPVTETKYVVRILSRMDNTLVRRPIYIFAGGGIKRVPLNLTNIGAFNVIIRGFVKFPESLTKDVSVSIWSIQDTEVLYTSLIA